MNILHVNGLPAAITESRLREIFEQIGPVVSVTVFRQSNGQCIGIAIVEMKFIEDVDEILAGKHPLAIGGIRPHIWHVHKSKVSELIRSEYDGTHLRRCKDRWYVFKLDCGHLEWCASFATKKDAE